MRIPVGHGKNTDENYRVEEKENKPVVFGIELPFKMKKDTYYEQSYENISLSEEEAYAELEKNIDAEEKQGLSDCQILEKSSEKYVEGDQAVINNTYVCMENIGKKEKILFED